MVQVSHPSPVRLSVQDARRLLIRYHFTATDLAGAFARHAGVQLDPLSPVGASHDLMLQARVRGYRVDGWRRFAYARRRAVDTWDKQACLVPIEEWRPRRIYHVWHEPRWRERVLAPYPEAVRAVMEEIRVHGPSTAAELSLDQRVASWEGGWYGGRLARNVARALWHTGRLAIRERRGFHHVYDLPERVLPPAVLSAPPPGEREAVRELILARHRAVGLLRASAPGALWSMPLTAQQRRRRLAALADEWRLVPVEVDGTAYHAVPAALATLDSGRSPSGVRFLAPLDPLVWDRDALRALFGFDYVWEVYKPAAQRSFGWYVLPVMDGTRFVARAELLRRDDVLVVAGWWWEPSARGRAGTLSRLERAVARFARYLSVGEARVAPGVPPGVADAVRAGAHRRG